jgi:hypothetical protein
MQQSLVRLLLTPVDLSMDDTRALLVPQVIPAQHKGRARLALSRSVNVGNRNSKGIRHRDLVILFLPTGAETRSKPARDVRESFTRE